MGSPKWTAQKVGQPKNLGSPAPEHHLASLDAEAFGVQWPRLARVGFTPDMLRRVVEHLATLPCPADDVARGMDHAEYELATARQLTDKEGQLVASPTECARNALHSAGSYRAPRGYLSPEDQRQATEIEAAKARKAHCEELDVL